MVVNGQQATATRDKINEILNSDQWTEGEQFIVKWQFNHNLRLLGHFKCALIEAIALADEKNLDRLALGFPTEVSGFRAWAFGDLARRLRAEVLDI